MGNDNLKKPKGIPEENIYLTLHWSIILVVILSCVFLYMLIFKVKILSGIHLSRTNFKFG